MARSEGPCEGLARAAGAALLALIVLGCGGDAPFPDDSAAPMIHLESPAFSEGGMIPSVHTCDDADRSPPLRWSGVPDSARSLVLLCDDPDAPLRPWSHWVLFNLSPEVESLADGIAGVESLKLGENHSARQGKNDFGKIGYGGPCPPSGTHRYIFRLYALNTTLDLELGATRPGVLAAMEGHILAQGRLVGRYARQ